MNCTLTFSLCAASSAAGISSWLLFVMLPHYLFAIVMVMTLMTSFAGLYIPFRCTRQRFWLIMPTTNLIWSTLLSMLVNGIIIFIDQSFEEQVYDMAEILDHLVRIVVAMAGLAMGISMQFFLIHYLYIHEAAELRRWKRLVWRKVVGAPSAQLVLCDDLAVCPGECAICLEELVDLPDELAVSPKAGSKVAIAGLLQLPCGHTFHGHCAERWMSREVTCPMCRKPIGGMQHCHRICLREPRGERTPSTPSDMTLEEDSVSREDRLNPLEQVVGRCLDAQAQEIASPTQRVEV
ncbi:unnamed protein product [Effrenium voratum]|nr:unnamed protein product [Effrenium voratum]|mmetsp:Transcript_68678/g.163575  ORF Transcript_68678/g.163575 Transcript_68678/m.163575 type:complete len:293 (-) Transcript_68678:82-960(-)